eukprot:PhF_6_TR43102/c0_g1_i2/m.65850/K15278/SLC35B4, YEA4; solute carrier family 35 (UDP-xylose/UDP-N-acetylglucosamine transporter), member B4
MDALAAITCVLGGCHTNLVSLEYLVRSPNGRGCGYLLTFLQFFFVALSCIPIEMYKTKSYRLPFPPLRPMLVICILLFATVSVINNIAFKYKVSVPLHTILRVGSLVTTLIVGRVVLKRKYSINQVTAVLLISIGIGFALLGGEDNNNNNNKKDETNDAFGVVLLMVGVLLTSVLGTTQEMCYRSIPTLTSSQMTFFSHLFSLPLFVVVSEDMYESAVRIQQEPELYQYLVMNIVSQIVCIHSVFFLTKCTSALTMNITITLRKFLSLVFSVWYFGHSFTEAHWVGCLLVFVGVTLYYLPSKKTSVETKLKAS